MFQDSLERHQIIEKFLDINRLSRTYLNVEFYAIVGYFEVAMFDVTKVKLALDGFHFGKVEVYPTAHFNANKLRTSFSALEHEYQLQDKTLVLKGIGSLANGEKDYTIYIKPISKEERERILRIG